MHHDITTRIQGKGKAHMAASSGSGGSDDEEEEEARKKEKKARLKQKKEAVRVLALCRAVRCGGDACGYHRDAIDRCDSSRD